FVSQTRIVGSVARGRHRGRPIVAHAGVVFLHSSRVIEIATRIGTILAAFDAAAFEFAGARSRGDIRASVIDGSQEAAVAAGRFRVAVLLRGHGGVALMLGGHLLASGPVMGSGGAAG